MSGVLTRSARKHRRGGGPKVGAGRPMKEQVNPNTIAALHTGTATRQARGLKRRRLSDAVKQLGNPKGRSWTYDECKLLICLVNGLMSQQDWSQTDTQCSSRVRSFI